MHNTMTSQNISLQPKRAWVVFSGKSDLWYLRFLRRGFKHCFVVLHDGVNWITIDPLSHHTEVMVQYTDQDFYLPGYLERQGMKVIRAPLCRDQKTPAPFSIMSCVESVKRVLGLHHVGIMTPYQLYRHLTKKEVPYGQPVFSF